MNEKHPLIYFSLCSDLKEGYTDHTHLPAMLSQKTLTDSNSEKVWLKFIPHLQLPSTAVFYDTEWVKLYRHFLIAQAVNSLQVVSRGGYFVVGVKDIRKALKNDEDITVKHQLIPLTMLIMEDLKEVEGWTLKDIVICVPSGKERDKKNISVDEYQQRLKRDQEEWVLERNGEILPRLLPIVHVKTRNVNVLLMVFTQAFYFIYELS